MAAALIAVAGVAITGRLRRKPLIVPVTWPLWAEGGRHDGETGAFEGPVHAIAVPRQTGPQVVHYLIAVAGRAPFWATSDELHWFGAPPDQPEAQPALAIGYILVPSDPSAGSEAAFCAQAAAIEAECARQGWQLDQIVRDPQFAPGIPGAARRGFAHALERIADAEAQALVVCELQDLTRSASDLALLLDWFTYNEATLVALDIGLDTTSPTGEVGQQALASLGAWERERHLNPEHTDVLDQVVQMRSEGLPIEEIAHALISQPITTNGTDRETADLHDLAAARRRRHHTEQGTRHGRSA